MKITFNRNIQFTRLLKVRGRLKEFNFRKANASVKGDFTLDVLDDEGPMGNRIIFRMENKEDKWSLVRKNELPEWIMERENDFNELIAEELKRIEL
ncbi:MAG: hypothetical protein ABIT58_10605 [Ferruginibacter sp.]